MPNEQCFFILEDGSKKECRNVSSQPDSFIMHTDDVIDYLHLATAIEHTHPNNEPHLSTADRECQIKTQLPWVLNGKTYRPCWPLLGRVFEYSVEDCFTLFRDFYHLAGHEIRDYRPYGDWWDDGGNMYIDNFEREGFYQVKYPEIGDTIMISLGSDKANHAAMYIGNNKILHHLPGRLSKRDNYAGYYVKYTHSIWRHKEWQPSDFTAISEDLAISSKYTQRIYGR